MSKAGTKVILTFSDRETAIRSLLKAFERFMTWDDSAKIVIEGPMDAEVTPKVRTVSRNKAKSPLD